MAKQNEDHEGLTIIIRRNLNEVEKEELKEIVDKYEYQEGVSTIGFF